MRNQNPKTVYMNIAKKLYTYAGCPENVTHIVGELGHRFYAGKGYRAFNKMSREVTA